MSNKEFKKRIENTKKIEEERQNKKGFFNTKDKSIYRINNTNVIISWENSNISIREKSYSIECLKELPLKEYIKGEHIQLSRFYDTVTNFIVTDNTDSKINLKII